MTKKERHIQSKLSVNKHRNQGLTQRQQKGRQFLFHTRHSPFVTRLTRRLSLVEQELLTLPELMSSPPVLSGVRVSPSLVLCVCFVDRCLSLCTLSFGHCVVCYSSIYGFWLPLWYLQTLLRAMNKVQYMS